MIAAGATLRRAALTACLAGPLLAGAEPGPWPPAELLDGSHDRVVQHAHIPSDRNVHGDLRLMRRGDAVCMQTLLYSNALRRGLQRMRKKELYAWPEADPGHADSAAYLALLDRARDRVLEHFPERAEPSDDRMKMLIEFVLSDTVAFYAVYEVELEESGGEMVIRDKRPVGVNAASRAYVARAMRLMADSGFGDESMLDPLLGSR